MRNFGLSQTLITDDPSELGSMLDNKSIDISSIDELTPETILISYIQKREWVSFFRKKASLELLYYSRSRNMRAPTLVSGSP